MKRFLVVIVGLLVVFGFAAVASAEVTFSGEIKQWNWWTDNMSPGSGLSNNLPMDEGARGFSMTRVRLGADIKVSDNLKGMVQLETRDETDSVVTTPTRSRDFYYWGTLNKKQSAMNIREAWILYTGSGLLGAPAGLKTGHQGLILGHGKFLNLTRYGTDAIVFFVDPNPQTHIGVLTAKASEGTIQDNTNDIDAYTGLIIHKLDDKNTIGVNYSYVNQPDNETRLQNLGLHAGGSVGGLDYKAEVDLQFGDLVTGLEQRASAVYLGLGYKADPVTLRASFAVGSGDTSLADNENSTFINFLGPDMNVAWIYEYQIAQAASSTPALPAFDNRGTSTAGLRNTTLYNLGLDTALTKDVALAVDGYLFRATKVPANVSKKVGSEVDAKLTYKISKGLTWTILAGFFSPDEFYGVGKKTATAARSDLTLSF